MKIKVYLSCVYPKKYMYKQNVGKYIRMYLQGQFVIRNVAFCLNSGVNIKVDETQ